MGAGRPRIPEAQKKIRGTYKPCRDLSRQTLERDPAEKKPRRPRNLTGYGAEFWHARINGLWEKGWLTRSNVVSFIETCRIYKHLREIEDDIAENGLTQTVKTQYTEKTVERPEAKIYQQLLSLFLRYSQEMGLTPQTERRYMPKKAEKAKKPADSADKPANIRDFLAYKTGVVK